MWLVTIHIHIPPRNKEGNILRQKSKESKGNLPQLLYLASWALRSPTSVRYRSSNAWIWIKHWKKERFSKRSIRKLNWITTFRLGTKFVRNSSRDQPNRRSLHFFSTKYNKMPSTETQRVLSARGRGMEIGRKCRLGAKICRASKKIYILLQNTD